MISIIAQILILHSAGVCAAGLASDYGPARFQQNQFQTDTFPLFGLAEGHLNILTPVTFNPFFDTSPTPFLPSKPSEVQTIGNKYVLLLFRHSRPAESLTSVLQSRRSYTTKKVHSKTFIGFRIYLFITSCDARLISRCIVSGFIEPLLVSSTMSLLGETTAY